MSERLSKYIASFDYFDKSLKSDSHPPKTISFIFFNEGPLKIVKNTFYLILKAVFVLKIFKSLS